MKSGFFKFPRWGELSTRIILFGIIPVGLIMIGITFGSIALHSDAMRTLVGQRDERTVRSAANALREQLNHRATSIQSLALRANHDVPLEIILDSIDFLLDDFDVGIAFYSAKHEELVGEVTLVESETLNLEIQSIVQEYIASNQNEAYFSRPILINEHPDPLLIVVSGTSNNEKVAVGVLSIASLARQSFAGTTGYQDETSIYLVDQEFQMIFNIGNLPESTGLEENPGVIAALHGESGTTFIDVNGREHVIAFNPVLPTGWALIIEEPWESVASPLLRYTESIPIILVPIFILTLAALWLSTKQIVQPLRELETRASALTSGDFEAIEDMVGGIEEIEHLQNTLIHMSQKVQRAQKGLRNYIGAITTGQEDERRRLARELHDDTLQSLIALNQRIQLINKHESNNLSKNTQTEIQSMISEIIQDLRRLTRALRPLYLEDLGLVPALEMLAQETSQIIGIPINFYCNGSERRLSEPTEIAIYRIAQEALSNILRHAQANQASVFMIFNLKSVQMTISDDGVGFEMPDSNDEFASLGHYGLIGIYERADLIDAQIDIRSVGGEGTQMILRIPE